MAGRTAPATSASGLTKAIDWFFDGCITVVFAFITNFGMAALFVANSVLGGVVLMEAHPGSLLAAIFGWSYSIGTSALLMSLWKSTWRAHWKAILPLIPAVVLTAIDTTINLRFPLFLEYNAEVMRTAGFFAPHMTFMLKLEMAAVGMISLFGMPGVLLIRSTRDHVLRIGPARKATPAGSAEPEPAMASA